VNACIQQAFKNVFWDLITTMKMYGFSRIALLVSITIHLSLILHSSFTIDMNAEQPSGIILTLIFYSPVILIALLHFFLSRKRVSIHRLVSLLIFNAFFWTFFVLLRVIYLHREYGIETVHDYLIACSGLNGYYTGNFILFSLWIIVIFFLFKLVNLVFSRIKNTVPGN